MAADPTSPQAFQRQATGLVREAGWWDVLVYNVNFISIGLMAAFLFGVTIPFYPGVNVYLNELIAFGLVIPLSMVFAMFAAALPRSGGDYVYVSRTLHPAVGMMSSFNNTVWWFLYGGVPSAFFARYGLGPFFRSVGAMAGSTTMVSWGNTLVEKTAQRAMIRIAPAMTVPRLPTSVLPQLTMVLEPAISPTVRRNGPSP